MDRLLEEHREESTHLADCREPVSREIVGL